MSRTAYMAVFAVIALAVVVAVHYYLWARLVRDPALPSPWGRVATISLVLLAGSIPAVMIAGRLLPFGAARFAAYVPYVWMGMMMLLVFYLAAVDVARLFAFAFAKLAGAAGVDPQRRLLVARAIAGVGFALICGLTVAGLVQAERRPIVERLEASLPGFPAALDGLKVVQISDLHLGLTAGGGFLGEIVDMVNALGPDVVVITGDLVDGPPERLRDQVAPLEGLRATRGVFFVTGNHEYYSGVEEWLPEIERLGVRVLRNERVEIGDEEAFFYLAGVDDDRSGGMAEGHGPDFARALDGREEGRATVLLAHQPSAVREATDRGVDLVLSGHTHGGQIRPFDLLVRLQQPYVRGLYRHTARTWVYVNQGTGLWGPPLRLGTRGEITEITLSAAGSSTGRVARRTS